MRGKRITERQRKTIVKLKQEKLDNRSIGKKVNLSPGAVCRILREERTGKRLPYKRRVTAEAVECHADRFLNLINQVFVEVE